MKHNFYPVSPYSHKVFITSDSLKKIGIVTGIVAGGYVLYKAGSFLRNWYAQRSTIPNLIMQAEHAIVLNTNHVEKLDRHRVHLLNIRSYGMAAETELEAIALLQDALWPINASVEGRSIRGDLEWYKHNDLLSHTQIGILTRLAQGQEQLSNLIELAEKALSPHRSYFNSHKILRETSAYLKLFIIKYGDNSERFADVITAANLRMAFGYKVEDGHYLVAIAQRVQEAAMSLKNAIGNAIHYKKLHKEFLYALDSLEVLEECITQLPQFQKHVEAYNQHVYQQEQLRLERERIEAERRAARAAEEQARAAHDQAWQMQKQNWQIQEQNRLQHERNRIEKERNERERKAAKKDRR